MKMLDLLRDIDVILVPLEMIPYCHGKSELKFFEAALVGCVTVASATHTYASAIENGVTGYICHDQEEWFMALQLLCSGVALRRSIGRAARQVALNRYVLKYHLPEIVEAYGLPRASSEHAVIENGTSNAVTDQGLSSNRDVGAVNLASGGRGAFVLPDLLIGGGGHRKAIMFASLLEQAGIAVDLVFQQSARSTEELGDIINGTYSPFLGRIRLFAGSFSDYDWVIATSWSTAVSLIERAYPPS